ncbi:hypothetical protein EUX98_g2469 [Antrodiella citrinella]|uniref:Small RNA 2'-O-methyltransferase n=1 Tax=Antrodiella citrinella TaxID=2447956 RepID=A0A4S4MYZ1_9APHY|nr:hypothetical protein EUX98_g2469 [Antrodiella citrinella]
MPFEGNPAAELVEELQVTFSPALYLERRGWVLEILRRERVRQVLDVGCGEGELIGCICNPAPWLSGPLASIVPSTISIGRRSKYMEYTASVNSRQDVTDDVDDFLHINILHGLDISPSDLKDAVQAVSARDADSLSDWQVRWEPLDVKIWMGDLGVYNEEFMDIECIVATEVIEHLPENSLENFAPVLLGLYHPRMLLITTPSYTFNARFTPPNAPPGTRKGFLDPTKRTDRIFRHDDHKFEWTVEEFASWCRGTADQWDYEVDIGGVGQAQEDDPWGRDSELGFASQTAAFRRKDGAEYAQRRAQNCDSLGLPQSMSNRNPHVLLADSHHLPDSAANQPIPLVDIAVAVKSKMEVFQTGTVLFRDLWFEKDISTLCGGWIEVLVAAVTQHTDLVLTQMGTEHGSRWEVLFPGFVPRPPSSRALSSDAGHLDEDEMEDEYTESMADDAASGWPSFEGPSLNTSNDYDSALGWGDPHLAWQ